MSINEINEQAKESLKKYFKDSQDIQHDDDTKKQLTIEEKMCIRDSITTVFPSFFKLSI